MSPEILSLVTRLPVGGLDAVGYVQLPAVQAPASRPTSAPSHCLHRAVSVASDSLRTVN